MRLHRMLVQRGARYRVAFMPDPVCWTDAPEDLGDARTPAQALAARARREPVGESRPVLHARQRARPGWLAFPYFVVFELLSPLVEIAGLVIDGRLRSRSGMMYGTEFPRLHGRRRSRSGVMLSTTALLLEELSFHTYPKARHLFALFAVSILENFGYRQVDVRSGGCRRCIEWLSGATDRLGRHEAQSQLAAVNPRVGQSPSISIKGDAHLKSR